MTNIIIVTVIIYFRSYLLYIWGVFLSGSSIYQLLVTNYLLSCFKSLKIYNRGAEDTLCPFQGKEKKKDLQYGPSVLVVVQPKKNNLDRTGRSAVSRLCMAMMAQTVSIFYNYQIWKPCRLEFALEPTHLRVYCLW